MLGNVANGVLTASLWSPQLPYPGAKDYYNRYVELYSEAPYYHGAEGYSAVFVEADVWGRAESLDAKGIRTALNLDSSVDRLICSLTYRIYEYSPL